MKKVYMALLAAILIFTSTHAQKGRNNIGFGGDVCLPTGEFGGYFRTGLGMYGKGLLGVGKEGQVTLSVGYAGFRMAGNFEDVEAVTKIIPFQLGYRHHMNGFFIEPQVGYGIYTGKMTDLGTDDFWVETNGAFTWSAMIGYEFLSKLELSARYQSGSKQGGGLSLFALRVGYNFSLGAANAKK
jgi:hypothetical protein